MSERCSGEYSAILQAQEALQAFYDSPAWTNAQGKPIKALQAEADELQKRLNDANRTYNVCISGITDQIVAAAEGGLGVL